MLGFQGTGLPSRIPKKSRNNRYLPDYRKLTGALNFLRAQSNPHPEEALSLTKFMILSRTQKGGQSGALELASLKLAHWVWYFFLNGPLNPLWL